MPRVIKMVCCICLSAALLPYATPVLADDSPPVAITPDGGHYWGPVVDGQRQGQGRVEWRNGATYEGGFADGLFSGKGQLLSPNGDVFEGNFDNGMQSGMGRLKTRSGSVYVGEFHDGDIEGQGRFENERGDVYEGQFKGGLYHGQGHFVGAAEEYRGEFRYGEFSGKGEMQIKDGRRYVGDFVGGQFEGKGRLEYPSGAVYEGDFIAGSFAGQGIVTWPGGRRHEGKFVDWRPEGPGTYSDESGNTYEGTFKDGKLVGPARFNGKDGSRYEGEMKNWMPNGPGELHLANGDVYRGAFEYGMYAGEGTLTYAKPQADGRTQDSGTWSYGRLKKDEEEEKRRNRANVEFALYDQASQVRNALSQLRPRDPDAINLFLLTVAGDGSQEVFRREADFVRSQFDARFGTRGHSLALINSRNTVGSTAMATVTSIRQAIAALASAMDKERDILFLYFTSHGSKDKEIHLGLPGLELPNLSSRELGALLKESGIRWKVVVISACYAGSFFDDIRDPYTLAIAASRADRRSFGCADENDFTYFGRAFFKEALPTAASFEEAFAKASSLITEWEDRDNKKEAAATSEKTAKVDDRHSLPQLEEAAAIRDYLKRWWPQRSGAGDQAGAPNR